MSCGKAEEVRKAFGRENMRGRLLTVEGLDGSGKATQARLLCDFLSEMEIRVRKVSFPDYEHSSSSLVKMYLNGEFGSKPEDVNAYAASSFFAVDRYASYRKYWKASLENGEWVVADRYTTSNMIYQVTKLPRDEWDPFLDWFAILNTENLVFRNRI